MAYKPFARQGYSLEEMSGAETFTDSRGREWRIRVHSLAELHRFQNPLARLWMYPGARSWMKFFQESLMDPSPGLYVRVRRAMGLPDFSAKEIGRAFGMREARELRDRIVRANLDMGYEDFVSRCGELLKKKIADRETATEEKIKAAAPAAGA